MDRAWHKSLLADVSSEEMERHLRYLCGIDRTSGSPGENRAIDHLVEALQSYGASVQVHEFDAYLSYPVSGRLLVLEAGGEREIPAKTRAFSGVTSEGGVEGDLIYVPGGNDMFRDTETYRRLLQQPLAGKVVISEGGGRQNMITAQRRGAVGYIHIWPSDEDYIHEGIVTPVWGTPTPDDVAKIPSIPVISIKHRDGEQLIERMRSQAVRVRLGTNVRTGWHRVRLPVATIEGSTPEFVLVASHIDSWHLGATDNATGNVACLELARLFSKYRGQLRRGLRIAWWPCHSTGRYAGSTWYADHHWRDLHRHCVTYLNIDSPGTRGATEYRVVTAMAENAAFGQEVVREVTGQMPSWEHPSRAGDQSFWGLGVSSLFMLLSELPKEQQYAVGGCGGAWWWHTEEDTFDKIGMDVQVRDTQVYAKALAELCTREVLPFSVMNLASEVEGVFDELADLGGDHVDLSDLRRALSELKPAAAAMDSAARAHAETGNGDAGRINRGMMGALRQLVKIRYTSTGAFAHDPAVPAKPLPLLQPLRDLVELNSETDGYRFLRTQIVRNVNQLTYAVDCATQALTDALES